MKKNSVILLGLFILSTCLGLFWYFHRPLFHYFSAPQELEKTAPCQVIPTVPEVVEQPSVNTPVQTKEIEMLAKNTPQKKPLQPIDPLGYLIGFTSQKKEVKDLALSIIGAIPKWLHGYFILTGPAQFELNDSKAANWLDGFAMIYKFDLDSGTIIYSNKMLNTIYYRDSCKNNVIAGSTPPPRSTLSKWTSLFVSNDRPVYDNANMNIVQLNGECCALTETPQPICFDCAHLGKQESFEFDDTLDTQYSSAHPIFDTDTHQLFNYGTTFARSSSYTIYTIAENTNKRVPLATINAAYPSYMHSFALTKNYVILSEFPFVVNPINLVLKGKAFIDTFEWQPKRGTNFIVLDKKTGKRVGTFPTGAFFALHQINAFEQNGAIIIDFAAYENADILQSFYFSKIYDHNISMPAGTIKRFTINIAQKTVMITPLSRYNIELPRIAPAKSSKEYRYVYGTHLADGDKMATNLIKIDITTGDALFWNQAGCYPSEPTFVAMPGSLQEDTGVLMSVVLDTIQKKSFFLLLNAHTMEELARAPLPLHIPFTVHGNFFAFK